MAGELHGKTVVVCGPLSAGPRLYAAADRYRRDDEYDVIWVPREGDVSMLGVRIARADVVCIVRNPGGSVPRETHPEWRQAKSARKRIDWYWPECRSSYGWQITDGVMQLMPPDFDLTTAPADISISQGEVLAELRELRQEVARLADAVRT